jgi:hypothetical protein
VLVSNSFVHTTDIDALAQTASENFIAAIKSHPAIPVRSFSGDLTCQGEALRRRQN